VVETIEFFTTNIQSLWFHLLLAKSLIV
jgi:hypothetical protein